MKQKTSFLLLLMLLIASAAAMARTESRLEKQGCAKRLIVDGKPFIIIGGEAGNSMASSPDDVACCMDVALRHGYNLSLIHI